LGLGAKGSSYIVNIRGPEEVIASKAAAIQVVSATAILGNGDHGLAIHLAFDSLSNTDEEFFRFLGTKVSRVLESYVWQDIPCFYFNSGQDIEAAHWLLNHLLERMCGYPCGTKLECEVIDEGGSQRQEIPPGGPDRHQGLDLSLTTKEKTGVRTS
jgi:hypothetical protein